MEEKLKRVPAKRIQLVDVVLTRKEFTLAQIISESFYSFCKYHKSNECRLVSSLIVERL